MAKEISQVIPSGTMVNNFNVSSHNEALWYYCFGVSTMDNYFPPDTNAATVLPQIQAALDVCLANYSVLRSMASSATCFSFKNAMYLMRDTARDYGGTIVGAYEV